MRIGERERARVARGFIFSLIATAVLFPFAATAGEGGVLILSKNPQLSKIPDWPKGTGVGEPSDCNKDAKQDSLDNMRKRGETAYRCLPFEGTFGGQPWESGSGGSGLFELQLHPNSPTVWRVFKRDQTHLIALVAEFDANGKLLSSQSARSPTQLLTNAGGAENRGHAAARGSKESIKAAADPAWAKRRAEQNRCDPRGYPGGIAGLPQDCPGHLNLGPYSK